MNEAGWTGVHDGDGGGEVGDCRHYILRGCKHLKRLMTWLLRVFALLLAGFVMYIWSGLSLRVLIRFDLTGIDPGEPDFYLPPGGLPVDHAGTLFYCLGPIGWFVGLGVFGLALVMALVVYRWPWPLGVAVAVAPLALLVRQLVYVSQLQSGVLPVCLAIVGAEMVLALLAAVFCRRMARRLSYKGV